MQFPKNLIRYTSMGLLAIVITGCASALIGERVGADQVVLAKEGEVGKCKSLGRSTLSVVASIGVLPRLPEVVEENLLQMARNETIDKGGDTVVAGASTEPGKRSFEFFKCK